MRHLFWWTSIWVEVCHHLEIWNIKSTRKKSKWIIFETDLLNFKSSIVISDIWVYQPAVLLLVGIRDDDSVPIR